MLAPPGCRRSCSSQPVGFLNLNNVSPKLGEYGGHDRGGGRRGEPPFAPRWEPSVSFVAPPPRGDGGNRNRGRRDAITGTGHDKRCSHGRVVGRATAVACKYYNTHLIELACILVRFITCSNRASPTFKSHRLSTHTTHECQALTEATTLKKQIATEYQAVLPDTLPDHASLNLKIDKQ